MGNSLLKGKKINIKKLLVVAGCLLIVLPGLLLLVFRLEREVPQINLERSSLSFGESQSLTGIIRDEKSGIKKFRIDLLKGSKDYVIFEKSYPRAGLFRGGQIKNTEFQAAFEPGKLGIDDGKAVLRMVVYDYSWWGWWKGNKTYIEYKITIDTRTPEINILSGTLNISQGGAGLVIYQTSEDCQKSGVHVGESFFPGYLKGSNVYAAFIALSPKEGTDTPIFVQAVDKAGNSAKAGLLYHIRKKKFKKDTIHISDSFLNLKMPEFEKYGSANTGQSKIQLFLKINRDLREENLQELIGFGGKSGSIMHWQGPFLRLPKSAQKASFADDRTYLYQGKVIDKQIHMGVDLASVSNSPVPAANSGEVIFAKRLGIYGKTVVLDHGLGVFSIYSHLSKIDARLGQKAKKGDVIGTTGTTGLAGGDHLHFGIFIRNRFTNPIEWWDASWLKNNIEDKMKGVDNM